MSGIFPSAHAIAHLIAYAVAMLGTTVGVVALSRPADFACSWGLPSQSNSPFVYVLGGRNIALGLLLLTFSYRGKLEEAGTVLLCLPTAAGVDAVVTWTFGDRRMVWKHIVPALLMTGFGWYLQHMS